MKCHTCNKLMKQAKFSFNEYEIDGWQCSCGEQYYEPEQAQNILLQNKLRREQLRAKLGKNRNNLILRVPKRFEQALTLKQGEEVNLELTKKGFKVLTKN